MCIILPDKIIIDIYLLLNTTSSFDSLDNKKIFVFSDFAHGIIQIQKFCGGFAIGLQNLLSSWTTGT